MRIALRVFLLPACTLAASAATTLFEVPVDRAANRPDSAWTAVRGSATPDTSILRGSMKSLRVEASLSSPDAVVRSAPIQLTLGKTYEIAGWVRTEDLSVRDTDRSPIASGA